MKLFSYEFRFAAEAGALTAERDALALTLAVIALKVFKNSFCQSQVPRISVNVSSILVMIEDMLKD